MSLQDLQKKWKPFLTGERKINDLAIRLYNADVWRYKAHNPNWRDIPLT